MDIVKIVRYIMMCLLEMVKMVFDGLCEHFTYKYIYIYARNMKATITYNLVYCNFNDL